MLRSHRNRVVFLLVSLVGAPVAVGGVVEALSTAASSGTANGFSTASSIVNVALLQVLSADGRFVVFESEATDLVTGQIATGSTRRGVYLRDRLLRTTVLVSHSSASPLTNANGFSRLAIISADGRFIAYVSTATDLVTGATDSNLDNDFFLFDRLDGSNTLITHEAQNPLVAANRGNPNTDIAAISRDGRFVLFSSPATNLVAGQVDTNNALDVFCFDRISGTSVLVSHSFPSPTVAGSARGNGIAISADGRWILFASSSTDLIPGQAPTLFDELFLFDRSTGTNAMVSHRASMPQVPGNGSSGCCTINSQSMSGDGRFVAFPSSATDLVAGAAVQAGVSNIYVYDRQLDTSVLLTPGMLGPANGSSLLSMVSTDGAWVSFISQATNLVSGQASPQGRYNVFLRDVAAERTILVSHSTTGPAAGAAGDSVSPVISSSGQRIAFLSAARDLLRGFVKASFSLNDVFLFDRDSSKIWLVSHAAGTDLVTGNGFTDLPLMSADGNTVAFTSDATDLVAGDANQTFDAFAYSHVAVGGAAALFPLPPCRVLDTRLPDGAVGGPALAASSARDFPLTSACGIPADAAGISVNVTVTQPAADGFIDLFVAGLVTPPTSLLNFRAGQTRANNAIVALGGTPSGTVTVRNASAGPVHVILDVNGYTR